MSWTSRLFNKAKNNDDIRNDNNLSVVEDIYRTTPGKKSVAAGDQELIAVITAAIQAFTNSGSENRLVVRSFKRIHTSASVWNAASLREQMAEF